MITVYIDKHFGIRQRIAVEPHVHERSRDVLSRKDQLYHAAYREPHYPVPAIRQHFEWGWSLTDNEPVLFHVVQGSYLTE